MLNQWWQQWMKDCNFFSLLSQTCFVKFSLFFSLYFFTAIRPKANNTSAKQGIAFTYVHLHLVIWQSLLSKVNYMLCRTQVTKLFQEEDSLVRNKDEKHIFPQKCIRSYRRILSQFFLILGV